MSIVEKSIYFVFLSMNAEKELSLKLDKKSDEKMAFGVDIWRRYLYVKT